MIIWLDFVSHFPQRREKQISSLKDELQQVTTTNGETTRTYNFQVL